MSAINNSNSKENQHNLQPGDPQEKKFWLGHSCCNLGTTTWAVGVLLLITGVVLFTLGALYGHNLLPAAATATGGGGFFILLGLITSCCLVGDCLKEDKKNEAKNTAAVTAPPSVPPRKNTLMPLPLEKSTRAFFEEKGFFGLPQELIDEITIWRKYRANPNLSIALDAGFILFGEPGTGKTTIAQCIAELLGGDYVEKKCGDLKSKWYGQTEKHMNDLFDVPEGEFRVVTIDEINGLLPPRHGRSWTDDVVNHFLGKVEGTSQTRPKYILVGTTNDLDLCDPAARRRGRLGKQFEIGHPNEKTRQQIFAYHLSKLSLSKNENWDTFAQRLAKNTDAFSCAAIMGIIGDAQRKALLEERNEITQQDFLDACNATR
jgi:hypothetical protein